MLKKTKQRLGNTVRPSKEHIAALREDLHSRVVAFKAGRGDGDHAKLRKDFAQVLAAWGIKEEHIPSVLWALKVRLAVFCVPPLLAAFLATQFEAGLVSLAGIICCLGVGIVGLITTAWRIHVLKCGNFIPFLGWLLGFFVQKKTTVGRLQ